MASSPALQRLGDAASVLIAMSLLMRSIVRFAGDQSRRRRRSWCRRHGVREIVMFRLRRE